jgi:hypothetical protein
MTTQVTATNIADLRRMINEPLTTIYTDVILTAIIEKYPLIDENGEEPRIPATDAVHDFTVVADMDALDLIDNEDWIATYDLNQAAADIWAEKASVVSDKVDFSADGGTFHRSQTYDQYMKQSRYFASRRAARTLSPKPQPHRRVSSNIQ